MSQGLSAPKPEASKPQPDGSMKGRACYRRGVLAKVWGALGFGLGMSACRYSRESAAEACLRKEPCPSLRRKLRSSSGFGGVSGLSAKGLGVSKEAQSPEATHRFCVKRPPLRGLAGGRRIDFVGEGPMDPRGHGESLV